MANSFGARHWVIDTPYTTASLPNGHIAKNTLIKVTEIDAVDATSSTHYSVQDSMGNLLFEGIGVTTDPTTPIRSQKLNWVTGIQVPVCDSPCKILIALE